MNTLIEIYAAVGLAVYISFVFYVINSRKLKLRTIRPNWIGLFFVWILVIPLYPYLIYTIIWYRNSLLLNLLYKMAWKGM